tara:strand:+ start:2163 stop:2705 length:543 start_codon:yes stop_codon:yes gene_type:complete
MKKNLERVIEIPEGIEVLVDGAEITIKSNGKELKREFNLKNISMKIEDKKLKISAKKATKRESKLIGTAWAHIKNMISGVQEDFIYKLEIVNVHFPMNVKVEGENVVIKSFLGETIERIAKIIPEVNVEVKGNQIEVKSANIEAAGQTAANIEKATRLTGRDRRVFQDGIFITEKPGRII